MWQPMAAQMNYLRRVKRLPGLDVQHARLRSSGGSTWKQFHCADSRSTSRLLGGQTKMVMIDGWNFFFFCTAVQIGACTTQVQSKAPLAVPARLGQRALFCAC